MEEADYELLDEDEDGDGWGQLDPALVDDYESIVPGWKGEGQRLERREVSALLDPRLMLLIGSLPNEQLKQDYVDCLSYWWRLRENPECLAIYHWTVRQLIATSSIKGWRGEQIENVLMGERFDELGFDPYLSPRVRRRDGEGNGGDGQRLRGLRGE